MKLSFQSATLQLILIIVLWGCGQRSAQETNAEQQEVPDRLTQLMILAEQQPQNAAVFNELALYYLSRDNFNSALHNINKSLELEPANTTYFVTLSDIYLMMGDAERAQLTLYRALDLEPQNADLYVHIGRLQVFREDYPRAFENFRKALELDRNNSKAFFWRGVALLENGDTARAISDWQLAVANDPESFDGYFQLGLLMAERKDRFAYDYLNHALRLAPADPDLLYDIGIAFQEINRFNNAIVTYELILNIDSCYYPAWFNIGYINLVVFEEYQAATVYFTDALQCRGDYVDALFNRGLAYEMLEDYENARKDYREVLRVSVNFPKAIEAMNRLDQLQTSR